jgi:hypothetical protein
MAVIKIGVKEIEKHLGIKAGERRMKVASSPRCRVCNKTPYEISEYLYNAEGIDPAEFVKKHERFVAPGRFYCTTCYVKVGMPRF